MKHCHHQSSPSIWHTGSHIPLKCWQVYYVHKRIAFSEQNGVSNRWLIAQFFSATGWAGISYMNRFLRSQQPGTCMTRECSTSELPPHTYSRSIMPEQESYKFVCLVFMKRHLICIASIRDEAEPSMPRTSEIESKWFYSREPLPSPPRYQQPRDKTRISLHGIYGTGQDARIFDCGGGGGLTRVRLKTTYVKKLCLSTVHFQRANAAALVSHLNVTNLGCA